MKVGDILYTSWGYDQTNIDFYEVVETKKKAVVIREIAYKSTPEKGFMTAEKMPVPGKYVGEPMLKYPKPKYDGNGETIKLTSYAWAYPWDGKPKSYSWYA